MNIYLKKTITIVQIERCLPDDGRVNTIQLHKMYDLTLRLKSQLLSVIYDMETFGEITERIANAHIGEAAQQRPLPYFDKAMVEIEIITPRGSNNAQLWDTSNRAIQVALNNLKGIFFEDDNMEHMAFSVVGRWGEKGATIIRILDFNKSQQIKSII